MKQQIRVWVPGLVLPAVIFLMVGLGGTAWADEPVKGTVEGAYPGLATGILKSARLTDMEKGMVLQAHQVEIRADFAAEILGQAEPEIRKRLEKNLFFLLEQKAMEMLIRQDALSMGISADQPKEEMLQAYVERLTEGLTVNEAEIRAFYESNKEMVSGMPFDQVRGSIEPFLLEQKKRAVLDDRIEGLGKRTDIRLNRDWVKKHAELGRDNPVDKARMSGKPTLLEFGAAGSVPCAMMQPILDKLRKKFPAKLNVVFVHVGENRILGARFGIRSIPVQVFYDQKGKEVFRHVGFFAEEKILKQLAELGVT